MPVKFRYFWSMQKWYKIMMSKKILPLVLVFLTAGLFFAFRSMGTGNPPTKYEKILQQVGEMLEEAHYSPKKIDDEFSKDIFKKYLVALDPDKNIFLQEDIQSLKKYETHIDDEIHGAPVQFFPAINDIYQKRVPEAAAVYKEILAKPFDYTVDETVITDADKLDFPASDAARKESWRKRLKYLSLERYSDLLDLREKNKGKDGFVAKSDADLEKEARDKVMLIMDRNFDRLRNKFTEEERFNILVNTITSTMDPHTNFFPPIEKRLFDETMSGRFYGIGASLRNEDGNIKIATLVTGSPAWKSGQVQVGDIILKVGQGKDEPQDLAGFDTDDAVKLIRGKKGTEVKLTLKKTDGSVKMVSLIRDEIVLEETFAKSAIIDDGNKKIGYIYLPEFYADWERPNGARCSVDVAKEIMKLKEQNVNGIIMDLRGNGGGSLVDVIQMVGLFIEEGPVVQVKDREGNPSVLRDRDKSVLYGGPLAVIVNELSASASEIFAAAIQDYKRGVIIGSSTTYGKGTVQRNIGLDPSSGLLANANDLGTLKLTLQKFYRINGGSTQLKGVAPDIVLPDQLEYMKFREKDDPDALKWDEIQKANYSTWNSDINLPTIEKASADRVANNQAFKLIKENTAWLSRVSDKEYPLNLKKYKEEQVAIRATVKQMENLTKLSNTLSVKAIPQDINKYANDKDKQDRLNQWYKNLSGDIYLGEAVNVMADMITQTSLAKKDN